MMNLNSSKKILERDAFFTRISYTYAAKPSGDLINFQLRGYLYELSPKAEANRNYKKMIWEASKRIYK